MKPTNEQYGTDLAKESEHHDCDNQCACHKALKNKPVTYDILLILTLVIGVILGMLCFTLSLQQRSGVMEQPNTLQITGVGRVAAVPDQIHFEAQINETRESLPDAQRTVNETTVTLLAAARELGVAEVDIKTTYGSYVDYSQQPRPLPIITDNSPTPRVDAVNKKAFTAYARVSFTFTDLEIAQKVYDKATELGATSNSMYYSVKDRAVFEAQAYGEAIANAKESAKISSEIAGITLGDITRVATSNGYLPARQMYDTNMAVQDASATPIQMMPGEQEITATVIVEFEIKP